MTTLHNEIVLKAPIDKVWDILSDLELLDKYDPTVSKSTLVSSVKTGIGAKRKVCMRDQKNWFEEQVTAYTPMEQLTYQLTDCSFPITGLKHSYSFSREGEHTRVKQQMQYTMKFGILGRVLNAVMVRKQIDSGVKKFFSGLKDYAETQ